MKRKDIKTINQTKDESKKTKKKRFSFESFHNFFIFWILDSGFCFAWFNSPPPLYIWVKVFFSGL